LIGQEQLSVSTRFSRVRPKNDHSPIPRIASLGGERGKLAPLFGKVGAVILDGDDRADGLLESVLDWLGLSDGDAEPFAFGGNLIDLARNHHEGNMKVGDMLRYVPKLFCHLARKFMVYRGASGGSLRTFPAAFYANSRQFPVPEDIVESVWDLMSDVLESTLPNHRLDYAVEVNVLVYPTSRSDVRRLHTLLTDGTLLGNSIDSAGFWTRLGHRIDAHKDQAAGVFQKSSLRDLFAIASLIPGCRGLVTRLNERMSATGEGAAPKGSLVIGAPHFDSSKYITGLIGRRDSLNTEILWNDRWIPLPVSTDAVALFPSSRITPLTNLPPTRHRILLQDSPSEEGEASQNITLSLAIVDRALVGNDHG
jgi:hypothetical protein